MRTKINSYFSELSTRPVHNPLKYERRGNIFEGALLVLSEFGIRKLIFFRRTKRTYFRRIDLRVSHFRCFSRNRTHFRRYNINAETSMNTESGNEPLPIYEAQQTVYREMWLYGRRRPNRVRSRSMWWHMNIAKRISRNKTPDLNERQHISGSKPRPRRRICYRQPFKS